MSSINGFDTNSIGSLFSSFGTTNTNSSANNGLLGINLTDYASIKNGSYGKLVKSYYALDEQDSKKTNEKNDTDDTDATLRNIKDDAARLKKSTSDLYANKSLFERNADGEYDMEAIYEKVSAFVEDYNSMVGSVGAAETDKIAKIGANMVNYTSEHMDMFKKIGISVSSSDFTLSIDKEKFMDANISSIKSMFSGVGSFAYQIGAKASRLENMVADKIPASGTYYKSETSSSTSKDTASTIAKVKDRANDMVVTGTDLYKNRDLFAKKYNDDYDTEEILEEIGAFIKDYNDLVIAAENTKSSGVENAVEAMTNITDAYEKELEKIGITIDDEDNTLKLNEAVFLKNDMKDVKDMFIGTGTFAYQVTVKATMVANQAETEANKANTYTDNAKYSNNYNTGTIFNDGF